ncbi:MAG TPA: hypothetical protein VKQ08_07240 [Cyclobacteriaceae bacterium]|nr:hypothetical protein [Cyclobacteriaceae bacterium]
MRDPRLKIKRSVWTSLVTELCSLGEGRRETGAFLLGEKGTDTVTQFICYNVLDPGAFDSGIIMLDGDAFIPLWNYCSDHGLRVLADVHTHPDQWTGQSGSDQHHPMIAQPGHMALIIPFYATQPRQLLKGVGIHEFLGDGRWRSWRPGAKAIQLIK